MAEQQNYYQDALNLVTPFARQFLFGGDNKSSDAGYVADRIQNNSLNGSGPNDPGLAANVATTLQGWLFGKPVGSTTQPQAAGTQVKPPTPIWVYGLIAFAAYLLLRRR